MKVIRTRNRSHQLRKYCLVMAFLVGIAGGFIITSHFLTPHILLKIFKHTQNDKNSFKNILGPIEWTEFTYKDGEFYNMLDTTVADQLYKDVRILCWVMTGPKNHDRAKYVKSSWGRRCNQILFISSQEDESLPTIVLSNGTDSWDTLWIKTKAAFRYVYTKHLNKADWFLKADDDTYIVLENLRYMLSQHDPQEPVYFGCRFKPYLHQGYMSGGAGYVLSREALKRLVENAFVQSGECLTAPDTDAEDIMMGKCLATVGVTAGDSRDFGGRERFFPLSPEDHLVPGADPDWLQKFLYYKNKLGMECCSDSAISFHYIRGKEMLIMDYLIYKVRPYGISFHHKQQNKTANNYTSTLFY